MEALRAGALSVVEKPTIDTPEAYKAMARRLCDQFVNMSAVKVVRQRFNDASPAGPRTGDGARRRTGAAERRKSKSSASSRRPAARRRWRACCRASAADFPAPILVVQHMGSRVPGGLRGLARFGLRAGCGARHGRRSSRSPGVVYVGPGGHHLIYSGRPPEADRRPRRARPHPVGRRAVPFAGRSAGPCAVGVLLTGMGDDGARGLLACARPGARTIGQNRDTCRRLRHAGGGQGARRRRRGTADRR